MSLNNTGRVYFWLLLIVTTLCIATAEDGNERKDCFKEMTYCQSNWQCCTNHCLEHRCHSPPTPKADETVILKKAEENQKKLFEKFMSKPQEQPKHPKVDDNNANASLQMASNQVNVKVTEAPCKEIGYKCYGNDECCTKRCHGFLHKCVT